MVFTLKKKSMERQGGYSGANTFHVGHPTFDLQHD